MAETPEMLELRRQLNQAAESEGWKMDFGGTPLTVKAEELPEPAVGDPVPLEVEPQKNIFGVEVDSDTREFIMEVTDPNAERRLQEEQNPGMFSLVSSAVGAVYDEGIDRASELLFGPDTAVNLEKLTNKQRQQLPRIAAWTQKFYALNNDPKGISDWIFSKSEEELAAEEAKMDEVNKQYLESVKIVFGLTDDQVGIRDGIPYVKFSEGEARFDLDADLLDTLRDQKFNIGAAVVGSGAAGIAGAKKAGESDVEKRVIKYFTRGASKATGPVGRFAYKAGAALSGWARPWLYSVGGGATGAGAGQYSDDWYNSLYVGAKMKQGIRFRRAFEAARAEAEFGGIAPAATAVGYAGVKALWNGTLGRLQPPLLMALRSQQSKMFDNQLVRGALLQANIDPDNPAVRQALLEATNEFSFDGIRTGIGRGDDVARAAGLAASSDVAQFVQPKGLQNAIETLPARTKTNAKEVAKAEKDIYDKFFGDSFQNQLNAQRRLNDLTKQYPDLKNMPDAVANEVRILQAGLTGFKPMNSIAHLLTRSSFWDGTNSDVNFFGRDFMKRLAHLASGTKILGRRYTFPFSKEGAETTTTVPGGVALGIRGKVIDQPSQGLGAVAKGINRTANSRANAFNFIQGVHSTARKAMKTGDALKFNPTEFRQFASVVETSYEAARQAVKSIAPKTQTTIIGDTAIPNIDLQRALKEAGTHDGNSADFITEIGYDLATKKYNTEELVDLAASITSWTRKHKFDSLNLPLGQKLLNDVLVQVDKKIASNLSSAPNGKEALRILKELRGLNKDMTEVRSNRAFQAIEKYAADNIDGVLTTTNKADLTKIIQEHSIAADGQEMTMLINQLPLAQGQALADHMIEAAVERNLIQAEGFTLLNTPAIIRELEGLRNSKLPFVKAKLDYLTKLNDSFGGFSRAAQMKPGEEIPTKTILQEAFAGVGAGGLGTSFASRWKVAFVTGMFRLMKKPIFDLLGLSPVKVNHLEKATSNFFAKPLDVEASAAMKAQIEVFKKGAAKAKDRNLQSEIERLEDMVTQIQSAAVSGS